MFLYKKWDKEKITDIDVEISSQEDIFVIIKYIKNNKRKPYTTDDMKLEMVILETKVFELIREIWTVKRISKYWKTIRPSEYINIDILERLMLKSVDDTVEKNQKIFKGSIKNIKVALGKLVQQLIINYNIK